MSTSVASVISFFPSAENGFATTASGSVGSGAATVGLNSVSGYANGEIAVFVIDPSTASKQTFTGVIDTGGVQVTDVIWTAGSNVAHATGATVVDYATATHISMITKGLLVHSDQDGTLKAGAVDVAAVLASAVVTTAKITDAAVTTAKLADGAVTNAKVAVGAAVQQVSTMFSGVATGTTVTVRDDTIPQNTEGIEFMTQAITPLSATNILVIRATVYLASSIGDNNMMAALFQDTTANALAVAGQRSSATANVELQVSLEYTMVAGTASETTFRIRAGGNGAGTTTFNGASGARQYGAIPKSSITITEHKAA